MKLKTVLFSFAALACGAVQAQDKPPLPFESAGACPFECCTYREWQAKQVIALYKSRSTRSPIVVRLRKGERADALTGVVVTSLSSPLTLSHAERFGYVAGNDAPQLSLPAGAQIYPLYPAGEGSFRFWYDGKSYDSGVDVTAEFTGAKFAAIWWKQLRTKAGKTGWTRSTAFGNADACG